MRSPTPPGPPRRLLRPAGADGPGLRGRLRLALQSPCDRIDNQRTCNTGTASEADESDRPSYLAYSCPALPAYSECSSRSCPPLAPTQPRMWPRICPACTVSSPSPLEPSPLHRDGGLATLGVSGKRTGEGHVGHRDGRARRPVLPGWIVLVD